MNLNTLYSGYILLGPGFQFRNKEPNLLTINTSFKSKPIQLNIIGISLKEPILNYYDGRLFIKPLEPSGLSLIDGLEIGSLYQSLRTVYLFCTSSEIENLLLLPINKELLFQKLPWTEEKLNKYCKREIDDFIPFLFTSDFNSSITSDFEKPINISLFAKLLQKPKHCLSCHYLSTSISSLNFDVCDWSEADYDPKFDMFANTAARESAFLNATKSIEAICGDLGSDTKKYTEKLTRFNLNVNNKLGRNDETIVELLTKFLKIRDKIAAHGSGHKRYLSLSEIIQYQSLANYIFKNTLDTEK